MGKVIVNTNYGKIAVQDCMVDVDDHCLLDGIDILDENGKLLCEIAGISSDDLEDNPEKVEELIDTYLNSKTIL